VIIRSFAMAIRGHLFDKHWGGAIFYVSFVSLIKEAMWDTFRFSKYKYTTEPMSLEIFGRKLHVDCATREGQVTLFLRYGEHPVGILNGENARKLALAPGTDVDVEWIVRAPLPGERVPRDDIAKLLQVEEGLERDFLAGGEGKWQVERKWSEPWLSRAMCCYVCCDENLSAVIEDSKWEPLPVGQVDVFSRLAIEDSEWAPSSGTAGAFSRLDSGSEEAPTGSPEAAADIWTQTMDFFGEIDAGDKSEETPRNTCCQVEFFLPRMSECPVAFEATERPWPVVVGKYTLCAHRDAGLVRVSVVTGDGKETVVTGASLDRVELFDLKVNIKFS